VPRLGFPLPTAHHCGLPASVKTGVGGSAADNNAGISVNTVIRASSCRATERASCTLRPCRRAPPAGGRALGSSGPVHRAGASGEYRLRPELPCHVEAPPQVSNTMGGISPRPFAHRKRRSPDTSAAPCLSRRWRHCLAGAYRRVRLGRLSSRPPRGPASRPTPSARFPLGGVCFRGCLPRGHAELGIW